jgi:hypothetical protein
VVNPLLRAVQNPDHSTCVPTLVLPIMLLMMTQAPETDPLVVAVVSVSLTLLVSVLVGVLTAFLARKGEHSKWLRERRYEAYVAFMIDMDTMQSLIETKPSLENILKVRARAEAHVQGAPAAFEAVSLLGPRKVNAAGQAWVVSGNEYAKNRTETTKSTFHAARWQFLIVAGKFLKSSNVSTSPPKRTEAVSSPAASPVIS